MADDDDDLITRARAAVSDRADLPGMSLMEHLEELRKRLIRSVIWVAVGVAVAYLFRARLIDYIQRPLVDIGLKMTMTHPNGCAEFCDQDFGRGGRHHRKPVCAVPDLAVYLAGDVRA